MKKLKKIPRFKSLEEEENFWATHDVTEYVDFSKTKPAVFADLKPTSKTISVRLPEYLIKEIKSMANKRGVPYQSMLKILLAEKVQETIAVR